jgi:hypothetical protein
MQIDLTDATRLPRAKAQRTTELNPSSIDGYLETGNLGIFDPKFLSLRHAESAMLPSQLNKMTISAGKLVKAFRAFGEVLIREMQRMNGCYEKPAYDIAGALR